MTADANRVRDAPEALLRGNLGVIQRVVDRACRHAGLRDCDRDDFAAAVNLALIEDDYYAILRAWQRRSSLATYLTVVVRRLLCDERNRARGRWEPSAESRRGGAAAILLETLVRRDGRSAEEAISLVRAIDASLSPDDLAVVLSRIPKRISKRISSSRTVPLDDAHLQTLQSPDDA